MAIREFYPYPNRFIDPIPADVDPQWTTKALVVLGGKEVMVERVLYFEAYKPGTGAWAFGVRNWREEGKRHGFVIHDRGGSTILPYMFSDGIPYIGLALNTRELANHDRATIYEAARGFHASDDATHPFETARNEVLEELGLDANKLELIDMTADLGITGGTNWNTTFVDSGAHNGVSHLMLEVPLTLLERDGAGFRFRDGVLKANPGTPDLKAIGEKVLATRFYQFPGPSTADQFTLSAKALFIEHMLATGRLKMSWDKK